jgi:hypothetical protein
MIRTSSPQRKAAISKTLAEAMAASRNLKSQAALVKKAGVAASTIGSILRAEVDPRTNALLDMARARVSDSTVYVVRPRWTPVRSVTPFRSRNCYA